MPRTVIEQIVGGIADAEGAKPENLNLSIEHYVSTDAIQELVTHESNSWRLQFETPNHVVEVTGNDIVLVDGEQTQTLS